MKIGYLVQQEIQLQMPPFDGPANHVRHVAAELVARGHEVRLLARQDGRFTLSRDLTEFRPVVVRAMDGGPIRWTERGVRRAQYELQAPYAAAFESARFALACRQELSDVDVLYERMSWVSYGGALAARWMHIPLVLENNGDALADLEAKNIAPSGMQRRLSIALMHRAVAQAAHVIASGDGWREQFISRWNFDSERVTTVENGTELVDLLQRDELRAFGRPADDDQPVTLAYVGGFLPWHGIGVLLEALAQAAARGADARLLLIGAGDGIGDARHLVEQFGLESSVTFTGSLSTNEFAPLLAGCDVGVSPYCGWPEYSGLKILDYKAAGLPTIASGLDGRPATVSNGITGLVVPPCSVEALRDAILLLCANGQLRRQMGQAARVEAEQCHSWERTARQVEGILAEAARQ